MTFKPFMAAALLVASASIVTTSCSSSSEKNENQDETIIAENQVESTAEIAPAEASKWMPDSATVLPSGLGIVIEKAGNEKRANATSNVTLHYKGSLTNGQVFDSSYDRGEPATFNASQVIPGFSEGIMQIGEGGKATLYIPSNLGYGPRGAAPVIGPNENLIFEIELLQIN